MERDLYHAPPGDDTWAENRNINTSQLDEVVGGVSQTNGPAGTTDTYWREGLR